MLPSGVESEVAKVVMMLTFYRNVNEGVSFGLSAAGSNRDDVREVLTLANKSKKSKMAKMRAHFLINAEEPHAKAPRRQGRNSGFVVT